MIKRELKVNLRSFLIWTGTMLVTLLLIYLVYPSIVSDGKGNKVNEMLEAAGIDRVEYLLNTHPHADHAGGLFSLLKRGFPIGAFITFFPYDYDEAYQVVIQRQVIDALEEAGVPILDLHTGETIPFGGATLTALRVPEDRMVWGMTCNNLSAMLMAELGDCRILLTGDVEAQGQRILASVYDLGADIMKFPHHGLNRADFSFLRAVSPSFAFFTNGSAHTRDAQRQLRRARCGMTFANWGILRMETDGTRWILHQDFLPEILKHAQKFHHIVISPETAPKGA